LVDDPGHAGCELVTDVDSALPYHWAGGQRSASGPGHVVSI
jgi:hypothetical protein